MKQGDITRPSVSERVEFKLADGTIEELHGMLLGAFESLYHPDFLGSAPKHVVVILVLF